ncbi:acetyl/propionyl/methylcrotonyl-CoA carboxylase subunit alpha [Nonomuraea jabiensis]|uniref:biotin carboxylase n=1 Tax=Nonomuraea jabiensis TaxID=882448 RepID=A0A7W9GD85_9ACTN|nr:biotin carboxylase N-terminal domain-containing protein [Nonomuraea jabiensis]MBB5781667.1 acetyl-CoA/propionyl-CoA carboxylase biotin carboxyl carrier protein [Nonomuraea jabiensis]
MRKVLVANRGEAAVRIVRACRDAGLASVAVFADSDRDALHVRLADEAFALGGETPAASYLDIGKMLEVAARTKADAIHPGWGFLAENAEFAKAVLDAGLIYIGPPPEAIVALGDKVMARRIAARVGAPLAAGTDGPVSGADEVARFAAVHGLPVAIKAAYGGGGRGLRVARSAAEIEELYESAAREARTAFGRADCFVERYLERPRHVETQCLADAHGTVVVVSTRDCSLQRRHQKLVEEAPAPFLTQAQLGILQTASVAILKEAGYVGAGTCEFLVAADGTISFLEVNTRLQVEHPVTEEVAGVDLVREMFRIAAGEPLGYDELPLRGHAVEFRINAEDPGRGFLPGFGSITGWRAPSGPGVRVDAGYEAGMNVPGAFDSLLAKLVVTGRTRAEALERSRRALAEFEITGIPTTLPFHRAVVTDPAFTAEPFAVHTQWIETEFATPLAPADERAIEESDRAAAEPVVVEVNGRRLEVRLPSGFGGQTPATRARPTRRNASRAAGTNNANAVVSPMQATIVKVAAADGERLESGELIMMLEAMKMEQPVLAHKPGVVRGLSASVGDVVPGGAVLCTLED